MRAVKRGRRRGQSGYLYIRAGQWYGQFRVDTRGGRKCRTVRLGLEDALSREQARLKLRSVISGFEQNSGAMARIGIGGAFTVESNLDPDKTSHLNKGIVSEMIVTVDMLSKGYSVYRAVSPLAACDLVATLDGERFFRIEVKTATLVHGDRVLARLKGKVGKFDLLAVVFGDGTIHYRHAAELGNDTYPLDSECDLLLGGKKDVSIASNVPYKLKSEVETLGKD